MYVLLGLLQSVSQFYIVTCGSIGAVSTLTKLTLETISFSATDLYQKVALLEVWKLGSF